MDAKACLAVFAKIQKIYEEEGTGKFLAFPLNNIYSFSPENLSPLLGKDAADAALSLEKTAEFSRIINTPVKGLFFPSEGDGTYLWDLYGEVLSRAEIAESDKSESELREYERACGFLFVKDEAGMKTDSEAYAAYCECKDRYYALHEELANLRSGGTGAGNLAKVKRKEAEIEALEAEWSSRGRRLEVEKNLNIVKNFEASCPSLVWVGLRSGFDEDTSLQKSLSDADFAPTYIYPSDVLGKDWSAVDIGAGEVEALCGDAPEGLRSKYGIGSGGEEIASIRFGYRSVLVERPWFNDSVFKSRLWRFPTGSSGEAVSYGPDSFAGRFPAYVCALLLARDVRVTYASGKEETSFSGEEAGGGGSVSVLAYICKHFPACPDPDPKAKWLTERKTAPLTVLQVPGGTVVAMSGGHEIGDGQVPVGDRVSFKAIANQGFILAAWSINGKRHPNPDYTYGCAMPEEGLRLVPCWEQSEDDEGIEAVISGGTLVSLSGAPSFLDMNKHSKLRGVTAIAPDAFGGSPDLCGIVIGNEVSSIGENAFSGCRKLESITIPKATRFIAKGAFSRDDRRQDPIITVDPENETYATVDGILEEKSKIGEVRVIQCRCGSVYFYEGQAPESCPRCGARLSPENAAAGRVRIPDGKIPFKINREAAAQALADHVAKKTFVSKSFSAAFGEAVPGLRPVYVPCWEWTVQARGEFKIRFTIHKKTGEKDGEGKEVTRQVGRECVQDVSFPEKAILVPASRIIGQRAVDKGCRVAGAFSFGDCPPETAFELYSKNMKESLHDAEEKVVADLTGEARDKVCAELAKGRMKEPGDKVYFDTSDKRVDFVKESCSLVVSPVWNGSFEYMGKDYPFHVDGYTGAVETVKALPKNWKLIGIVFGSVAAAAAVIAVVLSAVL